MVIPLTLAYTTVDDSRWQSRGSTTITESRACVYTTADDSASGRLSSTVADCSFQSSILPSQLSYI